MASHKFDGKLVGLVQGGAKDLAGAGVVRCGSTPEDPRKKPGRTVDARGIAARSGLRAKPRPPPRCRDRMQLPACRSSADSLGVFDSGRVAHTRPAARWRRLCLPPAVKHGIVARGYVVDWRGTSRRSHAGRQPAPRFLQHEPADRVHQEKFRCRWSARGSWVCAHRGRSPSTTAADRRALGERHVARQPGRGASDDRLARQNAGVAESVRGIVGEHTFTDPVRARAECSPSAKRPLRRSGWGAGEHHA